LVYDGFTNPIPNLVNPTCTTIHVIWTFTGCSKHTVRVFLTTEEVWITSVSTFLTLVVKGEFNGLDIENVIVRLIGDCTCEPMNEIDAGVILDAAIWFF
jgi:hypothetical protein